MKSTERKWSISSDGEYYRGQYDTLEQAAQEGTVLHGRFWVGQCITPTPPEKLFDRSVVDFWLDELLEHEDYAGCWSDGPWYSSKKQRNELAGQLRPLIGAWLDRHGLRPAHWNIDPETVRLFDAETEVMR